MTHGNNHDTASPRLASLIAAFAAVYLIWGSTFLVIKYAIETLPPFLMAGTRYLSSMLYGIAATDPLTFVVVSLVLAGVALLASFLPARRATRVDPSVILRFE